MLGIVFNILIKVIPIAYQIYRSYETREVHVGITNKKTELDKLPISQVIKIGNNK